MRIGIFTQWYDPEPGPAGLMGILARVLVERGHEVYVLTGFPNYPAGKISHGYRQRLRHSEIIDGVKILRVPLYPSHDHSAFRRIVNYFSFGISAALLGVPQLPKFDAIWVNFSPITLSMPLWMQNLKRSTPTVCEVADLWPDTILVAGLAGSGPVARFGERILNQWCNSVYAASSAVVYIAPSVGEILAARGVPRDRLHYIPKPANESLASSDVASRRHMYEIPEDAVVLLYAGALGEAQDLSSLLRACAAINDPRLHVLIAGSGTHEELLKQQALAAGLSQLRFLGRVPQEDMPSLYATADLSYVSLAPHPLSRVTMPSKTQAILSNGKAVLCAAEGDVANLVETMKVGYTAEPGNIESITKAILRALDDGRDGLKETGARARRTYEAEFSIDRLGNQAEALLLSIIGEAPVSIPTSTRSPDEHRIDPGEIKLLAQLHRSAFPNFFLSQLGEPFLAQFYRGFMNDPTAIVVIRRDSSGRVIGVAVGTTEPKGFFSRLLKRQFFGFAGASLLAAVRNPRALPRLLSAFSYRGDTPTQESGALLSSICVDPESSSSGIGKEILNLWGQRAEALGAKSAFLNTDAEANDRVNNFYVKSGWKLHDRYTTSEGRQMNRYRRVLTSVDL